MKAEFSDKPCITSRGSCGRLVARDKEMPMALDMASLGPEDGGRQEREARIV